MTTPNPTISGFSKVSSESFTFANGVNILSTISFANIGDLLGSTYTDSNVVALLGDFGSNSILTTGTASLGALNMSGPITTQYGSIESGTLGPGLTLISNVDSGQYFTGIFAGNTINKDQSGIYVQINQATVELTDTDTGQNYNWNFNQNGSISLPGNIAFADNSVQTTAYTGSTYGNANVIANLQNLTTNVTTTANVTAGQFVGSGTGLTGVAIKTTGTWTVATGTNTYSFTVPAGGVYQLWVECNIPNGILAYNATATVTNTNVPVVGAQYAWVYNGGGTPIDFVSIPNQFVGTGNAIVRSSVAPSATTNRFDFGINNTSGSSQTAYWGYVRID